jgi:hypothetical protein
MTLISRVDRRQRQSEEGRVDGSSRASCYLVGRCLPSIVHAFSNVAHACAAVRALLTRCRVVPEPPKSLPMLTRRSRIFGFRKLSFLFILAFVVSLYTFIGSLVPSLNLPNWTSPPLQSLSPTPYAPPPIPEACERCSGGKGSEICSSLGFVQPRLPSSLPRVERERAHTLPILGVIVRPTL